MNMTAKLSHIVVEFTPDEWEKTKKLLDFSVAHIEEINAKGIEEDPDKLPQSFARPFTPNVPKCTCTIYYRRRKWADPECKANHPPLT